MAFKLASKIRPDSGYSHILHILFNAMLPVVVLLLVRIDLTPAAVAIVLLAKWRMFAVKPRYWIPNVRSNLVDILVSLSVVSFIAGSDQLTTQLIWTGLYILWLVWLKPKSKPIPVMAQALIAQALSLVAFYATFPEFSLLSGVVVVWIICYASARHFFGAFEEPLIRIMTNLWAWFGAVMAWVLGHWVIDYLTLPQIALILTILGYGIAFMYFLQANEKLTATLKRQLIGVMTIVVLIIVVFSDWQDKTV